jgi:hypothetical protein
MKIDWQSWVLGFVGGLIVCHFIWVIVCCIVQKKRKLKEGKK